MKKELKDTTPKKMGRPTKYTDELADAICEAIATTEKGLHAIVKDLDCSVVSVFKWIGENENFANKYARAKECQAEYMAQQILTIADDSTNDVVFGEDGSARPNNEFINRSRLRVDSRKWLASKLYPKKYGDKVDVTSDGEKVGVVFKVGYEKPEDEGN